MPTSLPKRKAQAHERRNAQGRNVPIQSEKLAGSVSVARTWRRQYTTKLALQLFLVKHSLSFLELASAKHS
ncbi:hypothetical protein ACO0R3_002798, partial [Hanseniaspora guilliermondii]